MKMQPETKGSRRGKGSRLAGAMPRAFMASWLLAVLLLMIFTQTAYGDPPAKPDPCYCDWETSPAAVTSAYPRFMATYNDADDCATDIEVQIGTDADWGTAETWSPGWRSIQQIENGENSTGIVYPNADLQPDTSYYWRCRFRDQAFNTGNWSDTKEFRTSSTLDAVLKWNECERASGYYVHFGTATNPPQVDTVATTYWDPGPLSYETTYYWKVVAYNATGNSSTTEWCFQTAEQVPDQPAGPDPFDGETNVPIMQMLDWLDAARADGYYIYFGTSADPPYNSSAITSNFDPGKFNYDTSYYWKVIAYNTGGNSATTEWTFRTEAQTPPVTPDLFAWSTSSRAVSIGNGTVNSYSAPYFEFNSSDVDNFYYAWGQSLPSGEGDWTKIADSPDYDCQSWTVSPVLTDDGTYYMCVKADNAGGNSTTYALFEYRYDGSTPRPPSPCYCDNQNTVALVKTQFPAFRATYLDCAGNIAIQCEVQVGIDNDWLSAEMWNSGWKVISEISPGENSDEIVYNGSQLSEGTVYYWRIRFKDKAGNEGLWSLGQSFLTDDYFTIIATIGPQGSMPDGSDPMYNSIDNAESNIVADTILTSKDLLTQKNTVIYRLYGSWQADNTGGAGEVISGWNCNSSFTLHVESGYGRPMIYDDSLANQYGYTLRINSDYVQLGGITLIANTNNASYGDDVALYLQGDNIHVRDCVLKSGGNAYNRGMYIFGDYEIVENCTFTSQGGGTDRGLWVYSTCIMSEIDNCEFYDISQHPCEIDGMQIMLHHCRFTRNLAAGGTDIISIVYDDSMVYNNLLNASDLQSGASAIWLSCGAGNVNTKVFNNTIGGVPAGSHGIETSPGSGYTGFVQVRNNLTHVTGGAGHWMSTATALTGTNGVFDNNCVFKDGGGDYGKMDATTYTTLSAWNTASGMDNSSLESDPLFISLDPDNSDWLHIEDGSPCVNAGKNFWGAGITDDIDGHPRSDTDNWCIGADEAGVVSGTRPANCVVQLYIEGSFVDEDNGSGTTYAFKLPSGSSGDKIHVMISASDDGYKGASIRKRGSILGLSDFDVVADTVMLYCGSFTNAEIDSFSHANNAYNIPFFSDITFENDIDLFVLNGATFNPSGNVDMENGAFKVEPGGSFTISGNYFNFLGNCSIAGSDLNFGYVTLGSNAQPGEYLRSDVSLTVNNTLDIRNGGNLFMAGGEILTITATGRLKMRDAKISGFDGCEFGNGCRIIMADGADLDLYDARFHNLGNEGFVLGVKGVVSYFDYVEFVNPGDIIQPYVYVKVTDQSWNNTVWDGPVAFYAYGAQGGVHEFMNSIGFTVDNTWIDINFYQDGDDYLYEHASTWDYGYKNNTSGIYWIDPFGPSVSFLQGRLGTYSVPGAEFESYEWGNVSEVHFTWDCNSETTGFYWCWNNSSHAAPEDYQYASITYTESHTAELGANYFHLIATDGFNNSAAYVYVYNYTTGPIVDSSNEPKPLSQYLSPVKLLALKCDRRPAVLPRRSGAFKQPGVLRGSFDDSEIRWLGLVLRIRSQKALKETAYLKRMRTLDSYRRRREQSLARKTMRVKGLYPLRISTP